MCSGVFDEMAVLKLVPLRHRSAGSADFSRHLGRRTSVRRGGTHGRLKSPLRPSQSGLPGRRNTDADENHTSERCIHGRDDHQDPARHGLAYSPRPRLRNRGEDRLYRRRGRPYRYLLPRVYSASMHGTTPGPGCSRPVHVLKGASAPQPTGGRRSIRPSNSGRTKQPCRTAHSDPVRSTTSNRSRIAGARVSV